MNDDCLFCAIAAGGVPAEIVAETAEVLAFRDINPVAPTHVLVIPRDHVADSAQDLGTDHAELLGELFAVAARVAMQEGLDDGWRLVSNVGEAAGQTVRHVHFHLLGGWARSAKRLEDESGG